jgi:hypothetical protein
MADSSLLRGFHAFSAWRAALGEHIETWRRWLSDNDLVDAQTDLRLQQLLGRPADERLVVAVVADAARGKTELINAMFFADYGVRLLPGGAECATMCTTELLYDRTKPPCIELLPMQTRARHASSFEFKRYPEVWHLIPLDISSAEAMQGAFAHMRETMRVPAEEARRYGLLGPAADQSHAMSAGDGAVDVPRWRHALINFPHPLLAHGLVILATPDLNGIAAEPGRAPSALPQAHVALLVLAADSGVTGGDLAIWRDQIGQFGSGNCFAVLNKIDALWEGPRDEARIAAAIADRLADCSRALGLDPSCIFPVSAQEGLLGRIDDDDALVARSGLPRLEHALATELLRARHGIMGAYVRAEIRSITASTRTGLDARRRSILEQLRELEYLRGKNRGMIRLMMQKVGAEKGNLQRELSSYQALHSVFSAHTDRLFTHLGMDALSENWQRAREQMRASAFSAGVRSAMTRFLHDAREGLERSSVQVAEISALMAAMYRKFSGDYGLRLASPAPFSMLKYLKEMDRLEAAYERRFNTLVAMLTNAKRSLMQKFFETLASRVRRCYEYANREADQWLRAIMAPMETQVDEHQTQFMRRLESIKRIQRSIETLENRMEDLLAVEGGIRAQNVTLDQMSAALEHAIEAGPSALAQAA